MGGVRGGYLSPEWETQASEAEGGTQGLLFPFSLLSSRLSLVFPRQTTGTKRAACTPPPRPPTPRKKKKGAVNTGPIRP